MSRLKPHAVVAKNICRLRHDKKWTQEKLCDILQIDRRSLQRIESGQWNMTIDYLERFKIAFKCSWSDLINGLNDPS